MVNRDQVVQQSVQNSIEAGIFVVEEIDALTDVLYNLEWYELLAVLLLSFQCREEAEGNINYYHIGEISKN